MGGSTVTLAVYRDRGAFGSIGVLWSCTAAGANTSISPTSGSLVFQEGQRLANFTVSALDDGVSVCMCCVHMCGCAWGCVCGVLWSIVCVVCVHVCV